MNAPSRPILAVVNGHATTTSNQIAEHFGKRHDTVLRAIQNLDCSPEFTARNFAVSEYTDSTGRNLPAYTITRDGFVFLAMGFTGKEAAQWKEAYIEAFNAMEATLQTASPRLSHDLATPFLEIGVSCAEYTAYQAVTLAGNMIAAPAIERTVYAARVAFHTAAISLLNGAMETLKQERARLCRIMENADGSVIGDSTKWPEAATVMNLKSCAAPDEPAPRLAVKGGAA